MDVYTQLEGKLHDMTRRLTQEARYFHACDTTQAKASDGAGASEDASKPRYPLVHFPARFADGHPMAGQLHPLAGQLVPYPHPEHETTDSLAVRAQLSADALITLNKQVDAVLATLPEDEGKHQSQAAILEQLAHDNEVAGESLREETAHAQRMLVQVREALEVMGDDRSRDALATLNLEMQLAARGLSVAIQTPHGNGSTEG